MEIRAWRGGPLQGYIFDNYWADISTLPWFLEANLCGSFSSETQ